MPRPCRLPALILFTCLGVLPAGEAEPVTARCGSIDVGGGAGGDCPGAKAGIATGNSRINLCSGGGGGRVAIYSGATSTQPANVNIAGGEGGSEAVDGADGSFHSGRF